VDDGNGVVVFVGEGVMVGVHVAGKPTRGVGVLVGNSATAGNVGFGNGLNDPVGSKKIIKKTPATHNVDNKTITVRIFQMMSDVFLVLSAANSSL
jgi:hypothetical protein